MTSLIASSLPPLPFTQTWINKGKNAYPDWIQPHIASKRDPNGCFTIRTVRGRDKVQARVLVGNIVLLHNGVAHTCPASEARALADELLRADEPPPPVPAPGQRPTSSSAARAPAPRSRVPSRKPAAKAGRKQAYAAPLGSRPTIEWIHVDRLTMDDSYQRSTDNQASQRLIKRIASGFDWRLCTPLVVSRRPDGTFAVIDGQHRTLAAKMRHDIPDLPCCVFTYASPEEEAKMFIAANRSRKAMNRLDDFHAALAAGDDDAHQILQLVSDAGLTVARYTSSSAWKPGEIAFTSSILSTMRKHGKGVVSTALRHVADAFPDQKVVQSGSIFLGLVKILANPPEDFEPDRLFRALLKYDAEGWASFVHGLKGGDTRASAIRDALMMAYEEVEPERAE